MLENESRGQTSDWLAAADQITPIEPLKENSRGSKSEKSVEKSKSALNLSEFLTRRCPCCSSAKTISTSTIRAERLAERCTFDEIKEVWQHFFKKSTFFSYTRCASCGQLYCPVFFHQSQLVQLYGRMSDNTAHLPVEILSRTQRRYFDIFKRFKATTGTYLEFGPDIGLLTETAMRLGQFSKAHLIEPNVEVHPTLKQAVTGVSHQIYADINAYRSLPNASVDVIAMIHVLDHLLDPADILRTLKKKLRPGGKIVIVTHDESSLMARILGARWPAYCLQHPQLYNPKSMARCLESEGFKILDVRKTYNYFPITYLIKHLLFAIGFKKVDLPDWYGFTLPLKLGNIATVATL